MPGVSDVLVPQDIDYPSLRLNIDRVHASELGLNEKEVVDNVITALTSNGMIAPSYWVDPKTGNDYLLTVQYPENQMRNLSDLGPSRCAALPPSPRLDSVSSSGTSIADRGGPLPAPARDRRLRQPGRRGPERLAGGVDHIVEQAQLPNVRVTVRGSVQAMSLLPELRLRLAPLAGAGLLRSWWRSLSRSSIRS